MLKIPLFAANVLQTLEDAGFEACCVGGCVRDLLLGRTPGDFDVTTNAEPTQVMELFSGFACPTGLKHGTVTVRSGGENVEVTTYRLDGAYCDHRHPDGVTFTSSLAEDLQRRDFTVNAIALRRDGEIVDLVGGVSDLSNGVLRAVGDAERRFEEDALRILRCLRFSAVLGFTVEPATAAAMREKKELLRTVAAERVCAEITKLICGDCAASVLLAYSDILGVILPEILPSVGCDHCNPHHCYDVWEHIVRTVEEVPAEPLLRWVMLLHDLGKPIVRTFDKKGIAHFLGHQKKSRELAEDITERLRFDRDTRSRVLTLIEQHDIPMEPTERCLRRMLRRFGEENVRALLKIRRADNLAQHPDYRGYQKTVAACSELLDRVLQEQQCFSLKDLAVKGEDMVALGLSGRAVGEVLESLLDRVVEEELPNNRDVLLKAAEQLSYHYE